MEYVKKYTHQITGRADKVVRQVVIGVDNDLNRFGDYDRLVQTCTRDDEGNCEDTWHMRLREDRGGSSVPITYLTNEQVQKALLNYFYRNATEQ